MRQSARKLLRSAIAIAAISLAAAFNRPALSAPTCPARSAAMSVVGWLVARADAVTIHRYSSVNGNLVEADGYPKTSTDQSFVNAVLHLTGSYVRWNGYNSRSPFGSFYYPNWGAWYAKYEVHSGPDVHYVWMWRSYWRNPGSLLAFTFADMAQGTDSKGQHQGEHDFCMTSVPVWVVNRLQPS